MDNIEYRKETFKRIPLLVWLELIEMCDNDDPRLIVELMELKDEHDKRLKTF